MLTEQTDLTSTSTPGLQADLEGKIRWMARYEGQDATATASVYRKIALISNELATRYEAKAEAAYHEGLADQKVEGDRKAGR